MFNMTGSEVMFLLIIGLVVLGPEKLPDAIRRMGKLYAELKRMSSGVQTDFRKVMDEPIKEMMNTTNSMKALFTDTASEFQSAAKDFVEPTFIPYESGVESAQAQDSEPSDSDQDYEEDIAQGNAVSAGIAQEGKGDGGKLKSKSSPTKTTKTKPTKSKTKILAKKTSKKASTKKPQSKKPKG